MGECLILGGCFFSFEIIVLVVIGKVGKTMGSIMIATLEKASEKHQFKPAVTKNEAQCFSPVRLARLYI